jgi:hypothetical protein
MRFSLLKGKAQEERRALGCGWRWPCVCADAYRVMGVSSSNQMRRAAGHESLSTIAAVLSRTASRGILAKRKIGAVVCMVTGAETGQETTDASRNGAAQEFSQ